MANIPETMKAYGATESVDPIVHNDIAGWTEMVSGDAVDADNMLFDALHSQRLKLRQLETNNSVAAIVAYRIADQHRLCQQHQKHSVY